MKIKISSRTAKRFKSNVIKPSEGADISEWMSYIYNNNIEIRNNNQSRYNLQIVYKNSLLNKYKYSNNDKIIFNASKEVAENSDDNLISNSGLHFNTWKISPDLKFKEEYNRITKFPKILKAISNKIQIGIRMKYNLKDEYKFDNFESDTFNLFEFFNCVKDGIKEIGKRYNYIDLFQNMPIEKIPIERPETSDDSKLKDFLGDEQKEILKVDDLEVRLADLIESAKIPPLREDIIKEKLENIIYIPSIRLSQGIMFTYKEYPMFRNIFLKLENGRLNKNNEFLKKWLVDEFKIVSRIQDLEFTNIEGYGFSVKISNERSLYQVGYGITQLLPIILQIALLDNSLFIIEEPESNLHPALQSKLADFFVDASKEFNIQFIIETHSEYLIRKLQYLTAKKEIKPEDTQIYYFYPPNDVPEGEKQVYPINIEEDGSLTKNFGKGFFDEADNIALELFLLKNQNN